MFTKKQIQEPVLIMNKICEENCECLECTDFISGSQYYGLKFDEYSQLPDEIKRKLVRLMACIMENAYRRGVQQTLVLLEKKAIDEWILETPHEYRYGKSLMVSIGLDGYTTTSLERLECEVNLHQIGLT